MLVPDMINGLVVVETTWKSNGIAAQLNANFLLLLNINNTNLNTNFIELNRLYTKQLTVVNLQLVTSATCFGLVWP